MKLDPKNEPEEAVEWFMPTGNKKFMDWQGGIIGSVSLNDEYKIGDFSRVFATCSIDGNLYIGSQKIISDKKVNGPLMKNMYNTPVILFKKKIGTSISTPIFTEGNKLVVATYNGVYLFELNFERTDSSDENSIHNGNGEYFKLNVEQVGRFKPGVSFEATPVVWEGLIYICGRDGWLYALG